MHKIKFKDFANVTQITVYLTKITSFFFFFTLDFTMTQTQVNQIVKIISRISVPPKVE